MSAMVVLAQASLALACLLYQPWMIQAKSLAEGFDLISVDDLEFPELNLARPQNGSVQFGDLFKPQRSQGQRREVDGKNVINVCFFCDLQCEQQLTAASSNPQAFFDTISAGASTILSTVEDAAMTVKNHYMLLPKSNVELSWYTQGDKTSSALETATKNFWAGADKLYVSGQSVGCEAGFYVANSRDSIFELSSGTDAIANLLQLCTAQSFGTLMLRATNAKRMATVLAHEIGHLMGAYHDGPMVDDFDNDFMRGLIPTAIKLLSCSCSDDSENCPEDASGICVMNSMPSTNYGYPTQFSSCSRAYVKAWHALAAKYPQFYNDTCLNEGNVERDVQDRKISESRTINNAERQGDLMSLPGRMPSSGLREKQVFRRELTTC